MRFVRVFVAKTDCRSYTRSAVLVNVANEAFV